MWKFKNGFALRRFQGLRSLGIFALSVAFCLVGLLAVSSCDDDDDVMEAEIELEFTDLTGFFISVNADDEPRCESEAPEVTLEGDESTGKFNVSIESTGPGFPGYTFVHEGVKLVEDGGRETIATGYLSLKDGSYSYPGTYFLTSRTEEINGEDIAIFSGFWAGFLVRPMGNPVVICPSVWVPRGALPADSCGAADGSGMNPVLSKYFKTATGDLRECQRVLDADAMFIDR